MKDRRPCPRAFNEPERVYGYSPDCLAGVFIAFALMMITPIPKLLAVFISALAFVLAYGYSQFEVEIKIFVRACFQSARYTPERRRVIRLEIK